MRDMDAYNRGARSAENEQIARQTSPDGWAPVDLSEEMEDLQAMEECAAQGDTVAAQQADFLKGYLSRWD